VAVLAEIRCLDVLCVLARCVETVMAAGTTAGDARMVEYDRYPRRSRVAVIALVARLRMPWRFAGGDDAVVAVAAAAFGGGVIHVGDRAPGCRGVTVGAYVRCRDMVDRLGRRLDSADRGVTTDAGRIGSLEGPAGVAALAADIGVRPVEYETRCVVIERFLRA